jgi:hypothetical protein
MLELLIGYHCAAEPPRWSLIHPLMPWIHPALDKEQRLHYKRFKGDNRLDVVGVRSQTAEGRDRVAVIREPIISKDESESSAR